MLIEKPLKILFNDSLVNSRLQPLLISNYMKPFFTISLFLISLQFVGAQTPKLDSLNRLISQAPTDTARINLINKKAALLTDINLDSAISLSQKNISDAKRIKYKQGEATARLRLAHCFNFKGNYTAVKENLKLAESLYGSLKDSAYLLKVYNAYGTMYGMQSKYDSAITFFEKGIAIAERNGYKANLGNTYLNVGIAYDMLSNRPQALRFQQKALTLAESENNLRDQAFCLVNMANLYKGMDDLKGAEQRYHKALKLARQEGVKSIELYSYTNLASIYTGQHANQKAYEFAMKAAILGKEMGDDGIQASSLSLGATNLAEQKKFTEAEKLNKQAMAIADASQQPLNIHQTYSTMGTILKMQGKYAEAIPYYEKSFAVLKDADIYDSQTGEIYAELSACYEKTGNYNKALATYKTAAAITDSVRGKENIRKATELTMNYEFDKKQQAVEAEQQKQNAIAKARQLALLAGLALTLLLAGVSFYAYRTKKKANTLLESQKLQLQNQKNQLEQQKEQLQKTLTELRQTQRQLVQAEKMATMGKLTKGIVDRILNPLNYINNFALAAKELLNELVTVTQKYQTNYSQNDLEDLEDSGAMLNQNLEKINEHGSSTARILQDMQKLLKERSSDMAVVEINSFLEHKINDSLKIALKSNASSLPINLDFSLAPQPLEVNLLPHEFTQVLVSLIDNSCYSLMEKSRRATGFAAKIDVQTQQIDDHVQIQVRDNGRGIPAKELSQLFSPFFTTKPTAKGTGLGLFMSRDVVEHLQGQMTIDSVEGEYTVVTILLPLTTADSLV
ncbi:tetratricopeptide repeat protein [Spirosoma endbachense]|uniref:histidine kinase n=2 Tax=Spirosoma endbachense TaxID=2666025 RepID=A0A6P1VUW0_9BACT|nr:tetratricopeptide repeat protein [Spirosoma endbachense]